MSTRTRIDICNCLLASLLLCTNYLHQQAYPFFRFESLALTGILCSLFVLSYVLCRCLGAGWLFGAGLVFVLVDLASGISHQVYTWGKSSLPSGQRSGILCVALLLSGVVFLGYLVRKQSTRIICVGLSAALLSAVIVHTARPARLYQTELRGIPAPETKKLSNVFFIILDEHIGIDGIPPEFRNETWVNDLIDDYKEGGFLIFRKAFSNYTATLDSIPLMLNANIQAPRRSELKGNVLTRNRIFEKLQKDGYRLKIFQSTHLNLCKSDRLDPDLCVTYLSSAMGHAATAPVPWTAKISMLAANFVGSHSSMIVKRLLHRITGNRQTNENSLTGALATETILNTVKDSLDRDTDSTAYLIHILSPHGSYVLDSDCRVKCPADWQNSNETGLGDRENTYETRLAKYPLYLGQLRCVHRQLKDLFQHLKDTGLYESSTIVLVSDHGSRIPEYPALKKNAERMTSRDLLDSYSAFLAVKNGGLFESLVINGGGEQNAPISTTRLTGELFGILPQGYWRTDDYGQVYLQTDAFNTFERQDLPVF